MAFSPASIMSFWEAPALLNTSAASTKDLFFTSERPRAFPCLNNLDVVSSKDCMDKQDGAASLVTEDVLHFLDVKQAGKRSRFGWWHEIYFLVFLCCVMD